MPNLRCRPFRLRPEGHRRWLNWAEVSIASFKDEESARPFCLMWRRARPLSLSSRTRVAKFSILRSATNWIPRRERAGLRQEP